METTKIGGTQDGADGPTGHVFPPVLHGPQDIHIKIATAKKTQTHREEEDGWHEEDLG